MNKQIQELMKQAGTDTSGKWMGVEHAEKFAEMIVKECANIGERYADGNYEIRNQILNHFGLEEPEE
jgi:hypothetical protein